MELINKDEIQATVYKLLKRLWENRHAFFNQPVTLHDLIPIPVDIIIRNILDLELEEPEEILLKKTNPEKGIYIVEVGGLLDPSNRKIVIPRKHSTERRRFTKAHEIGHYLLHGGLFEFRDAPLTGNEIEDKRRPLKERQADYFAACLLMPQKTLKQYFFDRFSGIIQSTEPSTLPYAMPQRSVRLEQNANLILQNRRTTSRIISQAVSYKGISFRSLAERFGVSPEAMAIQLEELKLVI